MYFPEFTKLRVFCGDDLCPRALRAYVLTFFILLRAYVPSLFTLLCLSMYIYIYIYFLPMCLCALNCFVPMCAHSALTCLQSIIIYIEAHFYTSYCCFSLECFTFHSIQNSKGPNPILWDFVNWCMQRDNNLRVHSKLSNIMDSF